MKKTSIKNLSQLKKVGETPIMNEENVFPEILKKHMTPKGKYANVVVVEGKLDFIWEDDKENIITGDVENSIIIEPERYHKVVLRGPVKFKVEFYKEESKEEKSYDEIAKRPGEKFLSPEDKK